MKEEIEFSEELKKQAEELKKGREEFLAKRLKIGQLSNEVREEVDCYNDFKVWASETGFNISTLNTYTYRYKLYGLMQKEAGKRTIESSSAILLAYINKLQLYNEEKFTELLSLLDKGLSKKEIKEYLKKYNIRKHKV